MINDQAAGLDGTVVAASYGFEVSGEDIARFACGEVAVQASDSVSLKGLVVTLGMVLGDCSSRASTRER